MLSKIKSKTLQDLLRVFSGNLVSQGIGFLTIIIISRDLGVVQYGVFSLLLAVFTVAVQLSDFGTSTSYVKYVSENLNKSKEIFFTVFVSKIVLSFIIIIFLYLFSESISIFFFKTDEYSKIIELISTAVFFHSMYAVIASHYQAKQRFKQYTYMNIFHNLFKLISVLIVSIGFSESRHTEYFIYIYAFVLILILSFFFLKNFKQLLFKSSFDLNHFIQIYKLGFWIFLSSLATMIIMRLDIMMLQKMSTSEEVGYYSIAMNLAMIFPLITTSLITTLLPKMNTLLKNDSINGYINKVLSKTKYLIFILIILELLSTYFICLLFGDEYQNSASVFQILIVAFLFGVIINPISLVIYSINKAYVLSILNWVQLPLNYFGNLLLIPLFQADGAAISTVILRFIGGIYIIIYLREYSNDK